MRWKTSASQSRSGGCSEAGCPPTSLWSPRRSQKIINVFHTLWVQVNHMLSHFFIFLNSGLALVTNKDKRRHFVNSQFVNPHSCYKWCWIITQVTIVPQSLVIGINVLPYLHPLNAVKSQPSSVHGNLIPLCVEFMWKLRPCLVVNLCPHSLQLKPICISPSLLFCSLLFTDDYQAPLAKKFFLMPPLRGHSHSG